MSILFIVLSQIRTVLLFMLNMKEMEADQYCCLVAIFRAVGV
jgi:hypothetical protein